MTAPPTSPKPAEKKEAGGTEYMILGKRDDGGWVEFSKQTARSAKAAIRQALEGNHDGGTYVAVPAKSWQPQKASPQTVTTLKLESA